MTPNDSYMGRTAPLTSKRYILYIYSTNIGIEYFKHALYSPFFALQNAVCFIMLTCLVPILFTFYIQSGLKFKKNNSGAKGLNCIFSSGPCSQLSPICAYSPLNRGTLSFRVNEENSAVCDERCVGPRAKLVWRLSHPFPFPRLPETLNLRAFLRLMSENLVEQCAAKDRSYTSTAGLRHGPSYSVQGPQKWWQV